MHAKSMKSLVHWLVLSTMLHEERKLI